MKVVKQSLLILLLLGIFSSSCTKSIASFALSEKSVFPAQDFDEVYSYRFNLPDRASWQSNDQEIQAIINKIRKANRPIDEVLSVEEKNAGIS